MSGTVLLWVVFALGILLVLSLDLGLLNRKPHAPSMKEAAVWSLVWIVLALLFAVGVFIHRGEADGMKFLTGYVIELSLSVDNVFLFAVIFKHFQVPARYQHRVLFWGILSAVVLRGLMIAGGAALLKHFGWLIYVFGGFLIFTGIKMYLHRHDEPDLTDNKLLAFLRTRIRFTDQYHGEKFFTRIDGKALATPLVLVLALVESTDVIFALDSIPAIFAITTDTSLVFTSNILAILGLRSLYFLLAGVMDLFYYLTTGLSVILVFVGMKMLLGHAHILEIPISVSLGVIAGVLGLSIYASILKAKREPHSEE